MEKPSLLVYESLCKNKPVLVCENSNTYHTMCRWNKEFMGFSAVYYFDDYDGFFIPANTNQKRLENGLLEIKPALFLYKMLINFSPIKNPKKPKNIEIEIIKSWINNDEIYEVFKACLKNYTRIPQEAISYELIKNYKSIL